MHMYVYVHGKWEVRSVCQVVTTVIQRRVMRFSALSRYLMKGGCYLMHTQRGVVFRTVLTVMELASYTVQIKAI